LIQFIFETEYLEATPSGVVLLEPTIGHIVGGERLEVIRVSGKGVRVALVWEITNEDLLCSLLNGTRPLLAIIDRRRLKVGWG
jgi:hypothetical protein